MKKFFGILIVLTVFSACPAEQPMLRFDFRNQALGEGGVDFSSFDANKNMIALDIVNPTEQTVNVNSMKTSGSGFILKSIGLTDIVFPFDLEPGERYPFVVQFSPEAVGESSCSIVCTFAAADGKTPAATVSFSVKAAVHSLAQGLGNSGLSFVGNMTTLRFGDVIRGLSSTKEMTFTNVTSETVTVTAVESEDPFSLSPSFALPVAVAPGGGQIRIPVVFESHDLLPDGVTVKPVTVRTNLSFFTFDAEGSPVVSNDPLLILTAGTQNIQYGDVYTFSPAPINGEGAPETFRITNKGANPLTIRSLTVSSLNDAFELAENYALPVMLNADGIFEFKIIFKPTALGTQTGEIAIASDSIDSPNLNFTATGIALQPNTPILNVEFDGSALSEGDEISFPILTPLDEAVEQTIVLRSSGTADLQIASVVCENTEGDAFSLKESVLNRAVSPGNTLSLTAVFNVKDKAKGSYTATVTVVSNDIDSENFTLTLKGECSDNRELLPPIVNGYAFYGETEGDPTLTFKTPLGSAGTGRFEYTVEQQQSDRSWSQMYTATVDGSATLAEGTQVAVKASADGTGESSLPTGTYRLTVTEEDASGNKSQAVTFNLIVSREAPPAPVLTVDVPHIIYPADGPTEKLRGKKLTASSKPSWSWTDSNNSSVAYEVRMYSTELEDPDTNAPWARQSGRTFSRGSVSLSSGEYILEVRSVDGNGRTGEIAQDVLIIDNQPPQIDLNLQANNAKDPMMIIPLLYGISATVADFDPGLTVTDNNFSQDDLGDLTDAASYDLIHSSTEGVYKIIYTVSDPLGNTAKAERNVLVFDVQNNAQIALTQPDNYNAIDFPVLKNGVGLDIKKNSLLSGKSGSYVSQWLDGYTQLTFKYAIEGTDLESTDLEQASSRRKNLIVNYEQNPASKESKPFTVTAAFRKKDGTSVEVTRKDSLTIFPAIDLKNGSFETADYENWKVAFIPVGWNRNQDNYFFWSSESDKEKYWTPRTLDASIDLMAGASEPYLRVLTSPSDGDITEPQNGPAAAAGNSYVKFCDFEKTQNPDDIIGAVSALFQEISVVPTQKYRAKVRVRNYSPHTNKEIYYGRIQLQVHNVSMTQAVSYNGSGDGFRSMGFEDWVINSSSAVSKNKANGSANNDWQELTLDFTAPAIGSVALGVYIDYGQRANDPNRPVTDNREAVLIDDFRLEYLK